MASPEAYGTMCQQLLPTITRKYGVGARPWCGPTSAPTTLWICSDAVGSPRCSDVATNEHGAELVKEGGRRTLDKIIERMCDPTKEYSFFISVALLSPHCGGLLSKVWW